MSAPEFAGSKGGSPDGSYGSPDACCRSGGDAYDEPWLRKNCSQFQY